MEIQEKKENLALGILGAVIGGLIGGASIVLFSQLGMISALSGVILAFCTMKGYELLGGKLDKKAIAVSVIIMLVVPYFADRVGWAIAYCQAFEENGLTLPFGDAFGYIYDLLEMDELTGEYIKNILFVYGFAALGAFTIVKQPGKKKTEE